MGYSLSHQRRTRGRESKVTWRYQIYARDGEQWGHPYLDIGRALMRMVELNVFERATRYSLKPVRVRA